MYIEHLQFRLYIEVSNLLATLNIKANGLLLAPKPGSARGVESTWSSASKDDYLPSRISQGNY